jgi:hypothetical protein
MNPRESRTFDREEAKIRPLEFSKSTDIPDRKAKAIYEINPSNQGVQATR